MHQIGVESERNRLAGVLRATSGNATKRLKMGQETRVTTRAGKSAEAAIERCWKMPLELCCCVGDNYLDGAAAYAVILRGCLKEC